MSNYDADILIENINRLLSDKGMTQAQLGEILGMSQPNISKALNKNDKKSFTLDQVIGIAKYFHTTVDALIGGSQTSEIRITQRSAAAFLAELIAQHDAKFTTITKTEETYTPCWDQRDPYADSGPHPLQTGFQEGSRHRAADRIKQDGITEINGKNKRN